MDRQRRLANVNTLLAGVTFTPALDYNSNFTIATSVSDGVAPAITGVKAMTGTAVNDAPVVDLNAGAAGNNVTTAFTEQTPVLIAPVGTLTDVDSANLSSLTVTLTARPDGNAVESLSLNAAATAAASGAGLTVTYTAGTGVLSITGSATKAVYQSVLQGILYNDTSDTPNTSNRTINVVTNDGTTASVTRTVTLTVAAVNDAPTATNLSAAESYTEDTALNLINIVASDVDSANITATLTLSDVAAGSLNTATSGAVTSTFVGGVWTASGALADVNALLAGVTFTPALDYNSNFTIATSVSDGVAPAITGVKAMTGIPVNDAPTATNLSAAESYTEDTALNLINIVASDVDSANITATLTLSDVAAGSLNTATSGAVTSTFVGGVWTASGALADVNALLAGVTFTPALDYNSNFTIATSVSDGVAPAITGVKAMTGIPVNDAPTATNLSAAESYTEDTALNLINIVASDVDSANITATLTLSDVAAGSLNTGTSGAVTSTFVGGVWTASGALADVNALLAGVTFTPALDYNSNFTIATSVSDGVAPAITGVKAMTGIPVNDAPTATNLSAAESYTEDTALNLINIVASDVDSANITATLTLSDVAAGSLNTATSGAVTSTFVGGVWTASGALADVNALLAGVTFTPALDYNSNFTIATSVSDGVAPAITGVKAMTGIPVNDAPTATNLSAAESYTEDTALNLINIVASDVDSANITATLTLSDVAAGSLNTATSGAVTSTFVGGVWTASGALADVNALLAGVTFTPALDYNSNFTIATSVSDGVAPAITGVKAMTGIPVNDAPTATNLSAAESYTEDTALNLINIVASDVDSANITATLTLSDVAAGSLNTATSGAVTSTFVGGVWTASGALADVNALLAGVTFTPALDYNSNFTIATSVSDGVAPAITGVKAMTGIPVNDAPTATNLSAAESYTEDTALNLINIVASDVDSANITATLTLSDVAAGSLNTATSGAVTSTFVGGVWTASGALADVNALLAGVTFTPALDYNSNFTIATSVSDGVAPAITGVKAMTGIPVNDAPTATNLSAAESYTEDTALNLINIVASDVDSANITATLTLSDVAAGSLNTATSGAVTSTFVGGVWTASGALADVNALLAGVTFTPALDYNSNFTIATSVSDGVAPAITGVKAMTGIPVNDAPTATNLSAAESYTEDTALNLINIVASDVDSANITATLTLSDVAAGSLNTATSGAVTSTFVGGVWTASGALADVNALLAGVTFTPALDYNSNFTIATSVSDGVAPAITGVKAMTGIPVNDAPTATNLSAAESYTEDTALNLINIVASDVDSANITATLTLSDVAAGSLNTATSGAVTSTFVGGVWTASGALADVNALLAGVTFTPALDYNSNFTIATSVSDGVAPAITGVKAMTGIPVNDAPVNTVPGMQTIPEDTAQAIGGLIVTDVDGNLSTVQLAVANGTVTVTLSGGATITAGANGTSTLTLSGSQVDINATLASLLYQGTLNYNGPDTLTVTSTDTNAVTDVDTVAITVTAVDDLPVASADLYAATEDTVLNVPALTGLLANDTGLGDGGLTLTVVGPVTGGAVVLNNDGSFSFTPTANFNGVASFTYQVQDGDGDVSSALVTINVAPQNDAPVLAANTGAIVFQGFSDPITSSELQVTDVDNSPAQLTYTVTTAPVNGRLELTTAPGVAITSFTQADINAGRLVFVHSGAVSTSDSFIFTVSDGVGGMIGATTFTFTVTPFVPPPPPPPPPPGPGPVPVPVPVPGPTGLPPVDFVNPVLQPPPVLVTAVGAIDEPVRREAMSRRTFARVEQPDIVPHEPLALSLEPLSLPVKKMLDVGHKLAERLTRLADDLERVMQERENQTRLFGRVTTLSGMALSAGFVAWILRSGSLLASFLVSMPAWRHFDPLPVLGLGGQDRRKRDRKAREEQAQETKEFRGLDRVLKSSAKPAKRQETGRVRRPKS